MLSTGESSSLPPASRLKHKAVTEKEIFTGQLAEILTFYYWGWGQEDPGSSSETSLQTSARHSRIFGNYNYPSILLFVTSSCTFPLSSPRTLGLLEHGIIICNGEQRESCTIHPGSQKVEWKGDHDETTNLWEFVMLYVKNWMLTINVWFSATFPRHPLLPPTWGKPKTAACP